MNKLHWILPHLSKLLINFWENKKGKKKSSIVGIYAQLLIPSINKTKVKLHIFSALVTYNRQILINLTFLNN